MDNKMEKYSPASDIRLLQKAPENCHPRITLEHLFVLRNHITSPKLVDAIIISEGTHRNAPSLV